MKQNRARSIAEILATFDFRTCRTVMHAIGWTWKNGRPPTIMDLKVAAVELLDEVRYGCTLECGGLKASYDHGYLELEFVLRRAGSSMRKRK